MILIYSGGMDSTVMLYEFQKRISLAVNFYYGSKHNDREYKHARINAINQGVELIQIRLPFVGQLFKSALLKSGSKIPEGHYEDKSMKQTVIPFRNGIMLSIACGIAESRREKIILYANHAGDHTIYPDCREAFYIAMNQAVQTGTYIGVKIRSPYLHLTKRQIALKGKKLGVDFRLTYSCYNGNKIHCGKCGTCVERKEALEGFDPTIYQR